MPTQMKISRGILQTNALRQMPMMIRAETYSCIRVLSNPKSEEIASDLHELVEGTSE